VLVQVVGDACSSYAALVQADVEAIRSRHFREHPHGRLGEATDFGDLLVGGLVIHCNVTIRADQEVAAVVREEVEQDERVRASCDDQRLFVRQRGGDAERARILCRVGSGVDVDHSMRRPEPLEGIRNRGEVAGMLDIGQCALAVRCFVRHA
jgi:hypothetical protein